MIDRKLQHKPSFNEKYELSFKHSSHETGLFLFGKWNGKQVHDSLDAVAEAIAKKVYAHTDPNGPDNIQLVRIRGSTRVMMTYFIRPSWEGGDPRWDEYNRGHFEKDYLHARITPVISENPDGIEKKLA